MKCPYCKKTTRRKELSQDGTESFVTEESFAECQGKECPYYYTDEMGGHCLRIDIGRSNCVEY